MLNVLLWLPLAVALVAVLLPRRAVAPFSFLGSLVTLALAIALVVEPARPGTAVRVAALDHAGSVRPAR